MIRNFFAIVSGSLTGVIYMLLARIFYFSIYSFPSELDWDSVADRNIYLAGLSNSAHIAQIGLHVIGVFLSGLIASLIARNMRIAIGVISFSILLVFIIYNIFGYEYPMWFYFADTVITGLFGLLGAYIGSKRAV